MKAYLQHHRVFLTPLTPIHIGCGEDYEPTNYVIDEQVLYHFDPSLVPLDEQDRTRLNAAVNQAGDKAILALQRYFHERKARYSASARFAVPVTRSVAEFYEGQVGRVAQYETGGRRVANQLEIERTIHHPISGAPYIPGSSLKGSIRTAWLNEIDDATPGPFREDNSPITKSDDLEAELLGGTFSEDPFRQLKISDASGSDVRRMVVLSVDRALKQKIDPKTGRVRESDLQVRRREAILGGQHRALTCEIVLDTLDGMSGRRGLPMKDKRIEALQEVAAACNAFYGNRIDAELERYERFAGDGWADRLRRLLDALQPAFESGHAWLVRVGRNCGAESVTLERHRRIRIKGKQVRWEPAPTTVWLMQGDRPDFLIPFGWALVEMSDVPENEVLRDWCDAQIKPDIAAIEAALTAKRATAKEEEARQAAQRAVEAAAAAAEAQQAIERAARTATLGECGQRAEALRQQFENHAGPRQGVNGQLYASLKQLQKTVEADSWSAEERQFVGEALEALAFEKIQFPKQHEKDFRRWFAALKARADQ